MNSDHIDYKNNCSINTA